MKCSENSIQPCKCSTALETLSAHFDIRKIQICLKVLFWTFEIVPECLENSVQLCKCSTALETLSGHFDMSEKFKFV